MKYGGRIANHEPGGIREETALANFKVLFLHLYVGIEGKHEKYQSGVAGPRP
jgi:hypothetical protein